MSFHHAARDSKPNFQQRQTQTPQDHTEPERPRYMIPPLEPHILTAIAANGVSLLSRFIVADWNNDELNVFRSVTEQAYNLLSPIRLVLVELSGQIGHEIWSGLVRHIKNYAIPFSDIATLIRSCADTLLDSPSSSDAFLNPTYLTELYGPTVGLLGPNDSVMRAMLACTVHYLDCVDFLRHKGSHGIKSSQNGDLNKATNSEPTSEDEVEAELSPHHSERSISVDSTDASYLGGHSTSPAHNQVSQSAFGAEGTLLPVNNLGPLSPRVLLPSFLDIIWGHEHYTQIMGAFKTTVNIIENSGGNPRIEADHFRRIQVLSYGYAPFLAKWNELRCQREALYAQAALRPMLHE